MNANAVAKLHYGSLTPEERFRLILAAGARGDEAEQSRLVNAGGRITLSMQDHAPYAHAFDELALLVFIELLDAAAFYLDAFQWADDVSDIFEGDDIDAEDDGSEAEPDPSTAKGSVEDEDGEASAWQRTFDVGLAAGFMLRAKADGWKRYCEGLNIPPFLLWKELPGFDRLQRALALTEQAAFVPEGFLRWLNCVRPTVERELTEVPFTAEGIADATAKMYQARVEWWGG
jgi:hypothetical protein